MSKPFQFSSAARPQADVRVDIPVETPGSILSDADRITAARAIAIQHARESNSSEWGFYHKPEFFEDYGHGSQWLSRHLLFMAQLINIPAGLLGGKYLRDASSFNPTTGVFESDSQPLSLFDLTVAFRLRIHELGLSQPLVEEWSATIHSLEEDQAFYAKDFAGRMATFREKA